MSFAGHVFDMINRSKYNRDQLEKQREKIRNLRLHYINSPHYKHNILHEKPLSPEVREKIKSEIREKIRRENIKSLTLTVLTLIPFAFLGFYFLIRIIRNLLMN